MEPNGTLRVYSNDGKSVFKALFYYDLLSKMSHSARGSVGLFWLNAAEGWVDIKKNGQVGNTMPS